MSHNSTDNAIVLKKYLDDIRHEETIEKPKTTLKVEYKRSEWIASMLGIHAGGSVTARTEGVLTVPLVYNIRDLGNITNNTVLLNLGSEIYPHVFKFVATQDVDIRTIDAPDSPDADGYHKAMFFVVEAHQDGTGGHAITSEQSSTTFDVNQTANAVTVLAGMWIDGTVYLTNYGSRITNTISTPSSSTNWWTQRAGGAVDFGGNSLNNAGSIDFSIATNTKIEVGNAGITYGAHSGDTHKWQIDNTDEMELKPAELDLKNNKITNLGAPSSNTDASTKKYVDDKVGGIDTTPSEIKVDILKHPDTTRANRGFYFTAEQARTTFGLNSNRNAYFWFWNADLYRVSKIWFNTALGDRLSPTISVDNTSPLYAVSYYDYDTNRKRTAFQTIMNLDIGGRKSIAISRYSSARDLRTSYQSVTEIFGNKKPLLKLVNEDYYGKSTSARSTTQDIGSIYFDAKTINTSSSSTISYDQVTFAEIKARARLGQHSYPAYNRNTRYYRGDKVTYNSKTYIMVRRPTSLGIVPTNTAYWATGSNKTLNRGQLDFVLRDTEGSELGTSDDTFHDILSLSLDEGVKITGTLTMPKDSTVSGQVNVANFRCSVNLGIDSGTYINAFQKIDARAGINMHNQYLQMARISNLGSNAHDDSIPNKKYVDDKVASGGGGGGGTSTNYEAFTESIILSTGTRGTKDLGSSNNRWRNIHGSNLYVNNVYTKRLVTEATTNQILLFDSIVPDSTETSLTLGSGSEHFDSLYAKNSYTQQIYINNSTFSDSERDGYSRIYESDSKLYFKPNAETPREVQFVGHSTREAENQTNVLRILYGQPNPSTTLLDSRFGNKRGAIGITTASPFSSLTRTDQNIFLWIKGTTYWFKIGFRDQYSPERTQSNQTGEISTQKYIQYSTRSATTPDSSRNYAAVRGSRSIAESDGIMYIHETIRGDNGSFGYLFSFAGNTRMNIGGSVNIASTNSYVTHVRHSATILSGTPNLGKIPYHSWDSRPTHADLDDELGTASGSIGANSTLTVATKAIFIKVGGFWFARSAA